MLNLLEFLASSTSIYITIHQLGQRPHILAFMYPLVQADTLAVDIKAKEDSTHVFIDDIITITVDNLSWVKRTKNVALLVLHTIFRVLNPSEPLKLDVPL